LQRVVECLEHEDIHKQAFFSLVFYLFRPASDLVVSVLCQGREKMGRKDMNAWQRWCLLASVHDELTVEINHRVVQPLSSPKRMQIVLVERHVESIHHWSMARGQHCPDLYQ